VFDEPTFHLDRESTDAIKHALGLYEGTIILVTHDRDLIQSFATRVVELKRGKIFDYPGDFSYYLWKKKGVAQASKTGKRQRKKESRLEKLLRTLAEKEERRGKLRASFMRQALVSASSKTKKLFEEYQRLTEEVEELEGKIASEVNSVHSK
jgi:ATP-binding cassette subfamily F protein 3